MPPSGFSKQAINGLLTYIREVYKAIGQVKGGDEREQLIVALNALKEHNSVIQSSAIPFPISTLGVEGLNTFITNCVEDLHAEIQKGSDRHGREVRSDYAISKELDEIGRYLEAFTI